MFFFNFIFYFIFLLEWRSGCLNFVCPDVVFCHLPSFIYSKRYKKDYQHNFFKDLLESIKMLPVPIGLDQKIYYLYK